MPLTRRQLLRVGSLGMLGLGLPELLRARAAASGRRARERSCLFIVQYGGASHIDTFDPKPDAPDDIRGPYRPIATSVPGVQIGELLPRLARLADRYCLVRSMTHANGGHDGGMHVAMTGHSQPDPSTPYFGSVLAKVRPSAGAIPSYVWLQNLAGDVEPRYLAGGFLGPAYSPLRIGTDLDNPAAPEFRVTAFDPAEGLTAERLLDRQALLHKTATGTARRVVGRGDAGTIPTVGRGDASDSATAGRGFVDVDPPSTPRDTPQDPAAALAGFQQQAFELLTGPDARRAFDITQEPDAVRDRYGRHPLGQNLLLARRLIEAGVRLVSVTAWLGVAPGETFTNVQTWDMHGPGAAGHLGSIFGEGTYGLGYALPRLDEAVSALLTDLNDRGLLDDTLVVLVGEFGRSPRVVNLGRDHWPSCYTALLAGAGIRGGAVHGQSDPHGAYVKHSPVTPEDFGATLFHALGVPPETRLAPDGFTQPASGGQPLLDLFA